MVMKKYLIGVVILGLLGIIVLIVISSENIENSEVIPVVWKDKSKTVEVRSEPSDWPGVPEDAKL